MPHIALRRGDDRIKRTREVLRHAQPLLRQNEKPRERVYYRRQEAEQEGRDQRPYDPFADFVHLVSPPSFFFSILYAKNYSIGRKYVL
ncbi:hypothetical protein SDC9_153472 [bioreactor metagenome]|uniref:Uncharacterized protein n=1 Tax=bioreactor metagenome TaxID=1076179 RepID=A0A645EXS3_9ZZZZ